MTQSNEEVADWNTHLGIVEYTTDFGFGSGGNDVTKSFAFNKNCTIELRQFGGLGRIVEVEIASYATFGTRLNKIGSIRIDMEDHVAGIESDGHVRVSCNVIK